MSTIIAVANQKGGVAKTTTVSSLAGAFAQMGLKVLILDLDAQADLTLALGIEPRKLRASIADVLINSRGLLSVKIDTGVENVAIIPSNQEMDLAERFLPIRQNYEFVLREIIHNQVPDHVYDIVLLDCPPFLGAVTRNALNAADRVIIPTQPEYFSANALRSMLTAIRKIRLHSNPSLEYHILITMRDRRNRIHRDFSAQLRATFGERILQTVIEVDTKLRESSLVGLPITHFKTNTRSAQQYKALAQEITQHVQKKVA